MIEKLAGLIAGPRTRWVTLIAWIILAAVLSVFLPAVGEKESSNAPNLEADSPSVLADKLIKEKFPSSSGIPALIVWHREDGLSDEDYNLIQKTTQHIMENPLKEQGEVVPLHELPLPALKGFASEDGTTLVQPISFGANAETEVLKENIEEIKVIIGDASGKKPFEVAVDDASELSVRVSGPAGISVDATDLFKGADVSLLIATVLIVLVLLLFIYRSPILAIIPLVGVGFAYAVTSPLLGWMAGEGWITVDAQAISIMTVLLFGAGTDYCLFFISHFRQELTRENDKMKALKRSFKDASGAIAMSGFTVVLSLLALLAAKYGAYDRFAVPFSLSILIMGIASLTLVPALLAIIGRASFFPFIPRTEFMEQVRAGKKGKPYRKPNPEKKLGSKIGNLVIAKPWTVVISSVAILAILAIFSIQIKFTYDLLSSFPEDMPSREGFEVISKTFTPGELAPITVVVQTNGAADADLAGKLGSVPLVDHVQEPKQSIDDPNLISYSVILNTNPYSQEAMDTIPLLREAAQAELSQAQVADADEKVWIGGQSATQYDSKELTDRDNLVIIPLVIGLIMILLLAYLRSVTATLYLIGTVLLSYAAALGLGWIILHYFMGVDAIQGAIPLYSFVFLIALGEDYNIFMISSIWNKRKTMPLKQAIKEGVSETGGVITSAGLILAATFAVLASLPIQVLVQFGIITAIGVLMDTFIVRPFLVPAITTLLGKKAFWPAKAELVEENTQTLKG
ncbi:RND superfamily putative drug exporter [Paenibacillus endophyticus]|uniref:RND superfamily putative drug exporter n=1 Tax=Paenibacillus endophyticus TaxID=1294268 RepID=A0A7W5G9R2_9BACL|nr:MMPL family transporter [Paenibacillus endophyticus]MBB3151975.1 RND superfamily putative drug exporter [Paenibacillus endophyticus]